MTKKLLIIFITIFSYKLISNIINLIKVYYYSSLFDDFINGESNEIYSHKNHALELFKKANINDYSIPITQYTGFDYVSSGQASIFKNFPTNDSRFINPIISVFKNAIGIYKGRIIECFNPLYWINCIIFLPKNLLNYINISAESIITKIFQLLYWLIGIAATLFSSDITTFIKSLFTR